MPLLNKNRSSSSAADRRWWALVLLAIAEFVVVLDASIVNIALPSIGRGLHISLANLSWVVNAYVLTFGGFLLLGGRIADLLGRRVIFTVGLGVFSLASLLGGLAQSELWLISARAIQGLGAALLAWENTKLGLGRLRHWERIAVVGDADWLLRAIHALSWSMPGEVRVFASNEIDEARAWVTS